MELEFRNSLRKFLLIFTRDMDVETAKVGSTECIPWSRTLWLSEFMLRT